MIVNSEHGFGYIHAAKCGGSTIRAQLRGMDDFHGRFYRTIRHPVLGRVNGNHLPVSILAEYFPEEFSTLQAVRSYMLCREPMDRFVSAVAQWFRSETSREPAELSGEEIGAAVKSLIDQLRTDPVPVRPDLVYFVPQIEYAELNGERVIDEVIPLEYIDRLFDALLSRHQVGLIRDSVWNPTVTYRAKWMTPALRRLKEVARRRLTTSQYARLRDAGVAVFTKRGAPQFKASLLGIPSVGDFVAEHYAADTDMYLKAMAMQSQKLPDENRGPDDAD